MRAKEGGEEEEEGGAEAAGGAGKEERRRMMAVMRGPTRWTFGFADSEGNFKTPQEEFKSVAEMSGLEVALSEVEGSRGKAFWVSLDGEQGDEHEDEGGRKGGEKRRVGEKRRLALARAAARSVLCHALYEVLATADSPRALAATMAGGPDNVRTRLPRAWVAAPSWSLSLVSVVTSQPSKRCREAAFEAVAPLLSGMRGTLLIPAYARAMRCSVLS